MSYTFDFQYVAFYLYSYCLVLESRLFGAIGNKPN